MRAVCQTAHAPVNDDAPSTAPLPAEPPANAAPADRTAPVRTPPAPPPPPRVSTDVEDPPNPKATQYYLNRELTWLNFAWRVVHEAADSRTPLLERVKFLGIVGSTIDEFIMKRIGGLKQQVGAGMHDLSVDGRTPNEQIAECYQLIRELEQYMQHVLLELQAELAEHDIGIVPFKSLRRDEQLALRDDYFENIFPLVTPQAMDPAHPFPFISNLSLNLLVRLHYPKDGMPLLARVKVPVGSGIPRFLRVGATHRFVALEDVMTHNLDLLFPGMVIESSTLFRVTRNAHTEGDEDMADDLLAMIESELRERKFAPIVRLQVEPEMPELHRGLLANKFGLDENSDVFELRGLLGIRDLVQLSALDIPALTVYGG